MFRRRTCSSGSPVKTWTCQGWVFMEDGARLAIAMISSITARGTGSALKPRTLLRVFTSCSKSISGVSWVWPGGGRASNTLNPECGHSCKCGLQATDRGRPSCPGRRFFNLVLRPGFEVAGVVTFVQLTGKLAPGAVDHAPPLHRRTLGDGVGPALHVLVLLHAQEFAPTIEHALRQTAVPGPDRDICDRIVVTCHILVVRKLPVEHVELTLHLHREPIDRVFDLGRRVGVEVTKPAAEIGRAAHLPEQPRQAFG